MSDALWPGFHRAGYALDDLVLLDGMLRVEAAWSAALVAQQIAPPNSAVGVEELQSLIGAADREAVLVAAETDGAPVSALVRHLRNRLGDNERGRWLHRGLTSQDVLDTVLMMCARESSGSIGRSLSAQAHTLATLAEHHRNTPLVARTLTQHAVPMTFGLKAAHWLSGVAQAYEGLGRVRFPAQFGGAAGTLSAAVELAGHLDNPAQAAFDAAGHAADILGLERVAPWHTVRTPITRLGDALVECTDAWGHIANDILAMSRPEIAELSEASGGGSSTMPQKTNPVLSTLVRRAALTVPQSAATLHLAAAESVDERAAGSWHAEWETLGVMLARTKVAGSQTTDLVAGLVVHANAMGTTLAAAETAVRAEQRAMAALTGRPAAATYNGAVDLLIADQITAAEAIMQQR